MVSYCCYVEGKDNGGLSNYRRDLNAALGSRFTEHLRWNAHQQNGAKIGTKNYAVNPLEDTIRGLLELWERMRCWLKREC